VRKLPASAADVKTGRVLRIVKLLVSVALLAVFVWWGFTVKLGERTFFGHLQAIAQTKESQDLVRGTREKAEPLVEDVRRRVTGAAVDAGTTPTPATPPPGETPPAAPQESLTDGDRRQLRRVIGAARQAREKPEPSQARRAPPQAARPPSSK